MSTNEQQSQPAEQQPQTIDLSKPNVEHGIPALQLAGYYDKSRGVVLGFIPRGQNEVSPDDFVSKITYPNFTAAIKDMQACLDMAFQATATLATDIGYARGYKAAMNDVAANIKTATRVPNSESKASSPTLDAEDAAVMDSVAEPDRVQPDPAVEKVVGQKEDPEDDPLNFSLDLSMSGADSKPTKRKAPTGTINLNADAEE